jgi:hypothetical protein
MCFFLFGKEQQGLILNPELRNQFKLTAYRHAKLEQYIFRSYPLHPTKQTGVPFKTRGICHYIYVISHNCVCKNDQINSFESLFLTVKQNQIWMLIRKKISHNLSRSITSIRTWLVRASLTTTSISSFKYCLITTHQNRNQYRCYKIRGGCKLYTDSVGSWKRAQISIFVY